MSRCEQQGHQFHAVLAPGWFQCNRAIDYKAKSDKLMYCGQLAVCPACLGFVYSCLPVVFCEEHQSYRVEDFEVIACVDDTASPGVEQLMFQRPSLW